MSRPKGRRRPPKGLYLFRATQNQSLKRRNDRRGVFLELVFQGSTRLPTRHSLVNSFFGASSSEIGWNRGALVVDQVWRACAVLPFPARRKDRQRALERMNIVFTFVEATLPGRREGSGIVP